MARSRRSPTAAFLAVVGIAIFLILASGKGLPLLPIGGLLLVGLFVGASVWTVRRVRSRSPDPGEQAEWDRWHLALFVLEELAAGVFMVFVAVAMLFALTFESGLSSSEPGQTPFMFIIGGFLLVSIAILVWGVRQWALRSWSCFVVPFLVPVAALLSNALWRSLM